MTKQKFSFYLIPLLIAVFLGYLLVKLQNNGTSTSASSSSQSSQASSQVSAQGDKLSIGVLQLLSHPALDAIYQGIEDGLAQEGYGPDQVTIHLENAQGDQSNLQSMSQKLVQEDNDLVFAITTPAALSLAGQTKDLPIVLAGITYPVEAGLISSESQPGGNITGVSDRIPIKEQLQLMQQILPDLKQVGILYTASEDNSVKQAQEAEAFAKELGLEPIVSTVTNTNEVQQVTELLASKVQAIFIPIDNTLASAMATLVKVTDQAGIPVFPSADTMVKDGGVLGIGVDQYQIGVAAAKMAVQVLQGQEPGQIPIQLANQGVIYLNKAKADQLGISIPQEILDKAQDLSQKE